MRAYLFLLLLAAATTYLATPLARRFAMRVGAVNPVRERDVHTVPIPRLGGLAMLVGVVVSFLVASQMPFLAADFAEDRAPWAVLGAACLISLLGLADDVWGLDAFTKLAGQVLAAGLMAWQGVQFYSLPVGGLTVGSGGLFLGLTVLAVVFAINAVNFVDGLDGLAAGIVGIGGAAFFVYAYQLTRQTNPTDYSNLAILIVVVLVGVCLGFLPHNTNPARIFMGDTGSMLIGLLLAASAIRVTGQVDPTVLSRADIVPAYFPVLLPIAVLLIPATDLLLAVLRRVRAGQSPFAADKLHLHHRLLNVGHSHRHAVWVMYLWTAVLAFGAVSPAFVPLQVVLPVWAACIALTAVVTVGPLRRRALRRPGAPRHATGEQAAVAPRAPLPAPPAVRLPDEPLPGPGRPAPAGRGRR